MQNACKEYEILWITLYSNIYTPDTIFYINMSLISFFFVIIFNYR